MAVLLAFSRQSIYVHLSIKFKIYNFETKMTLLKPRNGRGRPHAFKKEDALDAAVLHFWKNGFTGTDLDDVAAAVNATKPSLYRRFGGKQKLFALALRRYAETYGSAAMAAFSETADIREATKVFLQISIENVTRSDAPEGCLIACVAAGLTETRPETKSFLSEVQAASHATILARFQAEIDKGVLSPEMTAETRASLLIALMHSFAHRARGGETREQLQSGVDGLADAILAPAN